jgi:hypothetical protein
VTRRKPRPTERRPADDAERSAREACELLGLGNDPVRLCPADRLRVDMVSTLRLVIDHAGEAVLAGGAADLTRLVGAVDHLTKLLPKAATEPVSHRADPRKALLEMILQMRDRDEIADTAAEPSLRSRIAELEAENAKLRAAARAAPGAAPVEAVPAAPANVVPMKPPALAAPAPAAPAAPAYDYDANTEWKSYVNSDGSISPTPFGGSRKYWGPV